MRMTTEMVVPAVIPGRALSVQRCMIGETEVLGSRVSVSLSVNCSPRTWLMAKTDWLGVPPEAEETCWPTKAKMLDDESEAKAIETLPCWGWIVPIEPAIAILLSM